MRLNLNNSNLERKETEYAKYLYYLGYLPGPDICTFGNKFFNIQNDFYNKASGCTFRCNNSKCPKKLSYKD